MMSVESILHNIILYLAKKFRKNKKSSKQDEIFIYQGKKYRCVKTRKEIYFLVQE